MTRKRIWLYAVVLFVLTGTILVTQVSWIVEAARIEERFLSQRVNMALCSAMDVLAQDRALCSNVDHCIARGGGTFEISLAAGAKQKIDSVIQDHLAYYNIRVPFQSTLSSYAGHGASNPLPPGQALLYPANAAQNVLVHIDIPSKPQLIRAQINATFILSIVVFALLIWLFINALRGLIRERNIRKETVDFINTMAHDLKTPISNISFALSLLARDQNNNTPSQNQYISIIGAETARLKERARKILGAASVDAVLEDTSDKTCIDVHEVIEQCIGSFVLQLQESGGTIEKQLDATRSTVEGSRLQLSSAVMNILDNAFTHSQAASVVRIKTSNEGGGIRIEIEDNGPGIEACEQELVFKKAYRVHNGKKLPEGFGLGLYLARTLVEKHGGRLSLTSDGCSGSCFIIQLPLV